MIKSNDTQTVWGSTLNTLGQKETETRPTKKAKPCVIVHGQGSPMDDVEVLKGRRKRKIVTLSNAVKLKVIADKKGNEKMINAIWHMFYCQYQITSVDGRYYGTYCRNRMCTLCSSIRKAVIINKYYPVMKEWKNPYFVTLTVKACAARDLKALFEKVKFYFNRIIEKYRKRNLRGEGIKLVGIKSLESNFNPAKRTYNPHLHLIVANKEMADIFIKEWLTVWPNKMTGPYSQDKRPVDDLEKKMIELIKYGGKIFDTEKKINGQKKGKVYIKALYNIYEAMMGFRIFDRFGFNLPKQTKNSPRAMVAAEFTIWEFIPEIFDWLSTDDFKTLTRSLPPAELISILEDADMEME